MKLGCARETKNLLTTASGEIIVPYYCGAVNCLIPSNLGPTWVNIIQYLRWIIDLTIPFKRSLKGTHPKLGEDGILFLESHKVVF